jgi:hypothetical protein
MDLFTRHYSSPPAKMAWPALCRHLTILGVDQRLQSWGTHLVACSRLHTLHLQADPSIYDRADFHLPVEIGQLQTLRSLTLLNLPIDFPDWIQRLTHLRYLTVRGTDLTHLPAWISQLRQLHMLRIENCALQSLPESLRYMTQLRELGLCDTQLTDLRAEWFPSKLQRLDFSGTGCYQPQDVVQLQRVFTTTQVYPMTFFSDVKR